MPPTRPAPPISSGGGNKLAIILAAVASITAVALVGAIVLFVFSVRNQPPNPVTTGPSTQGPISNEFPSTTPAEAPTTINVGELTDEQKRAATTAREWIAYYPTSRSRLIDRLTDESYSEVISRSDATVAVDSLGIDWDLQARLSAQRYVESRPYSRDGLVEQMSSEHGEGFTVEQATQGVDSLTIDWDAQAKSAAEEYAELISVSRARLIQLLTNDGGGGGFSREAAEAGIDAANIDFNAEAAQAAREVLEYDGNATCQDIVDLLSGEYGDGFTPDQGRFGAESTGRC